MKKLKLSQLTKDEIVKEQLSKIKGGEMEAGCGCGGTCRLTGERRNDRRSRRKNPPGPL